MLPMQARGTFRKHFTKPFEQVAAPDCITLARPTPDRRAVGEELVVEEEVRGVNGGEGDDEVGHLAPEEDEGVHVELVVHVLLEAIV